MRTIDQIQTYIANAQVSLADYWTLYIEMRADGDPNTAFLKRKVGIIKLYIVTIQSYIDNHPEELETINGLFNSLLTYLPSNFLSLTYSIYNPLPDNASGTIVISSVVKASNTVYGIVRLNIAPTSGADPVALGANDPRIATWDSAYALAQSAFDARVTASAFNAAGNLVLTKGDASTITTAQSVILNQSSSAQAADIWVNGIIRVEGQFTLPNITNDGEKPNVAVVDANGNFFKRTLVELAADIDLGGFTASRAIVSDALGVLAVSATTATQIGYLSTTTSDVQTQINNRQPLDADLTAIAALGFTATAFLKKTAANTWALDTNTYLTANQTITLSGDVSGSGSTAITSTIANDAVTFAKMQNISTNRLLGRSTSGTGNVEEITISTGLSLSGGALSSTITQYTDAMARLAISETITGIDYNNTTGVFSLTAGYVIPTTTEQTNWTSAYNNMIIGVGFNTANGNLTFTQQDGGTIVQDLDGRYLVGNETITLTGDVTGSGTTSIATTIPNDTITFAKIQNVSSGILLGRSTLSSGDIEEISLGTGLTLSAGVLSLGSLTANRVVITDGSGGLDVSSITPTKLGYLTDVTSNLQAQLDGKQNLDATLTALAAIGSTSIGFLVLNGVDSFATRVLEGATNRITINNPNGSGSNPTIDIASNYAGQSSITTLGTITSGVWNGSAIADAYILSAANWNEAYDEHINSITWTAATGNLQANQEDGGNITVNLDGRYVRISGETMTGYLTLVGNPINANHAANKAYVDSIGTGIAPKGGANAATTGTLPTYIPTSTTLTGSVNGALPAQDGITLTVGQKLLVKNEVSNQYNGLYTVTDVGSGGTPYILTRASNMDTWDELPRATVFIQAGSTQAGYTYYCTVATGGTLGTTPVTFEIFSIGSVYTAGAGIDITGNAISIDSGSIVDSMISASAAITLTKLAATTASRALVSDGSGYIVASATTATEIGHVAGVTSAIQTQINNKQPLDATLTALAAYNTNGFLVQTAADTFVGRTLQGQTNRIDITNGDGVAGSPTIDISATYVGQNTITTLGTVTTGTWNGTAIGDTYISSATIWNTAYNNMIVSASFNTATGLLTLTQQDTGSVTASLDGRYLTGNQAITLSGEASGTGATSISVTLSNSAVIGKVLTGYVSGAGTVAATDTILQAIQKLNGNIAAVGASSITIGSTNITLGSTALSLAGLTSVTSTTFVGALTGNASTATALQTARTINGTSFDGTANITVTAAAGTLTGTTLNATVVSSSLTSVGTIGTGVWQGTAIADAYISSAATWNAKIGGSGTTGYIPKFTGVNSIGDSIMSESGGVISVVGNLSVNSTSSAWISQYKAIDIGQSGFVYSRSDNDETSIGTNWYRNGAAAFVYKANGFASMHTQGSGVHTWYVAPSGISGNTVTFTTSMSLSSTELITFGAPDTGEAHIFGGSARVNGELKIASGNNITVTAGDVQILSNAGFGILSADGNRVVSIQNGAFGVTGAATFSSSVTANGALLVNNNAINQDGTRPIFTLQQSSVNKLLLGISAGVSDIIVGDAAGDVDFRTSSQAFNFSVDNGSSIAFKIASTGTATFSSSVAIGSITNATTDTDRFLVSDSGVIKYRTGAELLSDIGAASSTAISGTTGFIPKFTSSTAVGNSIMNETTNRITLTSTQAGVNASIGFNFNDSLGVQQGYLINANGGLYLSSVNNALSLLANDTVFLESGGTDVFFQNVGGQIFTNGAADTGEHFIIGGSARVNDSLLVTGALTVDTNTLVVDATNNRVGIKNATPTYDLDVTGVIRATSDARIGGKVYIGTNGAYIEEVLVGSTYELRVVDSAGNTTVIS